MHVVNHRPVVEAAVINEAGEAHDVQLLIDTARQGVLLTAFAAKRAHIGAGKRTRAGSDVVAPAEVRAVRIGKTRLELGSVEPQVVIESESAPLDGVDGLIGADVLSRYGRVTMNFPAEQLVLGEPATAPVLGARVPTGYANGVFTARITLGSESQRLVVDTGAVTTQIRERVPIRITGTRQGVWGPVVLAPFEVVSDPLFVTAGDGRLGGNLLERFTLRIDYERETLRISTT
jgi:hypothetical protein